MATATTATQRQTSTTVATKARFRRSRRRRVSGAAWTGMSGSVVSGVSSHRVSGRDVDARSRSQFGIRGGASVLRPRGAVGFGLRTGSGAHTGSGARSGLGAALTPGPESASASLFVRGGGFLSDEAAEPLGGRRATSTRSAPWGFGAGAFLPAGRGPMGSGAFSSLSGVVSVGVISTVWDPGDRRESPFEIPQASPPAGPQNRLRRLRTP